MKVSELVTELNKMHPDATVRVCMLWGELDVSGDHENQIISSDIISIQGDGSDSISRALDVYVNVLR